MAKQARKRAGASKKATKATQKKTAKKSAGAKKAPAKKPARGVAKSAKKGAATAKKGAATAKKGATTAKKNGVKAAKAPSTKRQRATPPPVVENPGTAEPITHDDPNERAQDAVDQAWDQDLAAGQADEADVTDQSATG